MIGLHHGTGRRDAAVPPVNLLFCPKGQFTAAPTRDQINA